MRKYFTILLSALLLNIAAQAQTDKQKISSIDKIKEEIKNNLPTLTLSENLSVNDSIGNGYRRVYRKNAELKLIQVEYKEAGGLGKNISKKVEWYFSNGTLIYSEVLWTDLSTNKVIDHQKLYLDDTHLIAWIKSGDVSVDANSKEFKETDANLRAYGMELAKTK